MYTSPTSFHTYIYKFTALSLSALLLTLTPVAALAQEASPEPETAPVETTTQEPQPAESTAPVESTAPEETSIPCTSADTGCGQGADQGVDQGTDQGGPSLQDLGGYVDESGNEVLPAGVTDTRQGALQGTSNGTTTDVSASNTNTGANSTNTGTVAGTNTTTTAVSNTATDATTIGAVGNTGGNTNSNNTSTGATTTGDANIGVTQVKNDNTTAINGQAGVSVSGHEGDYIGDLEVDFANAISLLAGDGSSKSIQAINDGTGSDSSNELVLSFNDITNTEVQNDGTIDNNVDVAAITGQNTANMNTSDAIIQTGDANIAATLVNLLNTTVLNGNLMVSVQDIFGNLIGDINVPDLGQLAAFLSGGGLSVEAENDTTGEGSTNTVDVNINEEDNFAVNNQADIATNVNATAITGQNEASSNTGGGQIDTGDATVSASNVTLANTTVEGGNWGLVIVNALNRWVGFLVGDSGEVRQLSQEETIREIEARNSNTGSDSTNTIEVNDSTTRNTSVDNDATITNDVNATAITGQNEASRNTGQGRIATGEANILTTAVNIANTTVKNANLGIAVINVFGNWFGDLLYAGNSLLAGAGSSAGVEVDGVNDSTGADSTNSIDVEVNRDSETTIDNEANVHTTLSANIDTGNNRTNRNTNGGDIETGKADVALHSRTIANLSALFGSGTLSLDVEGANERTGVDSENTIRAQVNDNRVVTINNEANVSTIIPGLVNTGNNEASFNTVGGNIDTGSVDADIAVDAIINRVVLALGGEVGTSDIEVDADLLNGITGQGSLNLNDVDATRTLLADIFNDAIVDTIIDLLFTTGSNTSNGNTAATSKPKLSQASQATDNTFQAAMVTPVELTPASTEATIQETGGDEDSSVSDHSEKEEEAPIAISNPEPKAEPAYGVAGVGGAPTDAYEAADRMEDEVVEADAAVDAVATNQTIFEVTQKTEPTSLPSIAGAFARAVTRDFSSETPEPIHEVAADPTNEPDFPLIAFIGSIMGIGAGGLTVRRWL